MRGILPRASDLEPPEVKLSCASHFKSEALKKTGGLPGAMLGRVLPETCRAMRVAVAGPGVGGKFDQACQGRLGSQSGTAYCLRPHTIQN